MVPESPGGGGGVLRYFHTYTGLGHFLGFQILNFSIFLDFQEKNVYFLGYKDFLDIFWGNHKIRLYLGTISMHFRVFS